MGAELSSFENYPRSGEFNAPEVKRKRVYDDFELFFPSDVEDFVLELNTAEDLEELVRLQDDFDFSDHDIRHLKFIIGESLPDVLDDEEGKVGIEEGKVGITRLLSLLGTQTKLTSLHIHLDDDDGVISKTIVQDGLSEILLSSQSLLTLELTGDIVYLLSGIMWELSKNSKLTSLKIGHTSMDWADEDIEALEVILTNTQSIRYLDLLDSYFEDQSTIARILPSLNKNTTVTHFDISHIEGAPDWDWCIREAVVDALIDLLLTNRTLTHLNLANKQLKMTPYALSGFGDVFTTGPTPISENKTLQEFKFFTCFDTTGEESYLVNRIKAWLAENRRRAEKEPIFGLALATQRGEGDVGPLPRDVVSAVQEYREKYGIMAQFKKGGKPGKRWV
jgi:hypothetical protein